MKRIVVASESTPESKPRSVVELLGVPGSGKTFVAEVIATERPRADVRLVRGQVGRLDRVLGVLDKLRRSAALLVGTPTDTVRLVLLVLRHKPPATRIPKILLNWLWVLNRLRTAPTGVCLILDQGIAQALWSTCYRSGAADSQLSSRLLDLAISMAGTEGWTILVVEAEPSVVSVRIGSRTDGRSPLDDDVSDGDQHTEAYRALAVTRAALESRHLSEHLELVGIDNSGDVETVRSDLQAAGIIRGSVGDR